jgi:flagellar motility protein MotE (MotC chaperone)
MFELVILQDSFVNNAWGLMTGVMSAFMIISGIAIFWANKVKNGLKNSTNANAQKIVGIIDNYVLPILKQGQETVEATQKQEVKAKQFGEILYGMFPEQAAQIKDKYEVKLVNLTADVDKATKGTVEYNEKVKSLEALLEEMKGSIGSGVPVTVNLDPTKRSAIP